MPPSGRPTGVMGRRLLATLTVAAFLLGLWLAPRELSSLAARRWLDDDDAVAALARRVARSGLALSSAEQFATGSRRFDGEWLFGTHVMAALGFGQFALARTAERASALAQMEAALDRAMSPAARAFDREAWGADPLTSLSADDGHVAYLGYLNLALSLHRLQRTRSQLAPLNDAVSAALARRLAAAPAHLAETYPGEIYPVDNAAAIASVALHARATGAVDPTAPWLAALARHGRDPHSGLLIQSLRADRTPLDLPRGSGTALAVYFISFVDVGLSRKLYQAAKHELADDVLGFGVLKEYPTGAVGGLGDIDSGPLIFGYSISATGFFIAGTRVHDDPKLRRRIGRTFELFGAPRFAGGELHFASGGALGDAILFAMLTAPRGGVEVAP